MITCYCRKMYALVRGLHTTLDSVLWRSKIQIAVDSCTSKDVTLKHGRNDTAFLNAVNCSTMVK